MKYNSLGRKGLMDIENEIVKLYGGGLPIKDICNKLNVGRQTVQNYANKHGLRRQRKHNFNPESFSTFTPESCYWAGFIAADGNISKKKTHIRIQLNPVDKDHITKLLDFVKDDCINISDWANMNCINGKLHTIHSCYSDINSTKIVKNIMDNFNIVPNKSLILKPPHKMPTYLANHYIRGYFDGDGTIYWHKIHKCAIFGICSGSEELMHWISDIIKKQVDYNFGEKALTVKKYNIFSIRHSHKGAKQIFHWIYHDSSVKSRLDRKYQRYLDFFNFHKENHK